MRSDQAPDRRRSQEHRRHLLRLPGAWISRAAPFGRFDLSLFAPPPTGDRTGGRSSGAERKSPKAAGESLTTCAARRAAPRRRRRISAIENLRFAASARARRRHGEQHGCPRSAGRKRGGDVNSDDANGLHVGCVTAARYRSTRLAPLPRSWPWSLPVVARHLQRVEIPSLATTTVPLKPPAREPRHPVVEPESVDHHQGGAADLRASEGRGWKAWASVGGRPGRAPLTRSFFDLGDEVAEDKAFGH